MAKRCRVKKDCWVHGGYLTPGMETFWPDDKELPDYMEVIPEADTVTIFADAASGENPAMTEPRQGIESLEADNAELREINAGLEAKIAELTAKAAEAEAKIAELTAKRTRKK